jgi:hypothetical protein
MNWGDGHHLIIQGIPRQECENRLLRRRPTYVRSQPIPAFDLAAFRENNKLVLETEFRGAVLQHAHHCL